MKEQTIQNTQITELRAADQREINGGEGLGFLGAVASLAFVAGLTVGTPVSAPILAVCFVGSAIYEGRAYFFGD